jgi:hypothetical protein
LPTSDTLPAEMRFITACVRAFARSQSFTDWEQSASFDWDRLLTYARQHRLIPLLGQVIVNGNVACPDSFLAHLRKERENRVAKSLIQSAELQRLAQAFRARKIDFIVLKGLPLARELYSGIANRSSSDIDLLINQKDTLRAFDCLFDLGYQTKVTLPKKAFTSGSGLMAQLRYFSAKDVTFLLRDKGVPVELHWRLSSCHSSFPIAAEDVLGDKRIDEAGMPVMNKELLVLYLCFHGAAHCWQRLHWLCDIAILFSRQDIDWDKVLAESRRLNVIHVLGMAVVLVREILRMPVPSTLAHEAELETLGSRFVKKMPQSIYHKKGSTGFNQAVRSFFWNLGLQISLANRIRVILRQLCPNDNTMESIPLPDWLAPLYLILHPLRVFCKAINLPIK